MADIKGFELKIQYIAHNNTVYKEETHSLGERCTSVRMRASRLPNKNTLKKLEMLYNRFRNKQTT